MTQFTITITVLADEKAVSDPALPAVLELYYATAFPKDYVLEGVTFKRAVARRTPPAKPRPPMSGLTVHVKAAGQAGEHVKVNDLTTARALCFKAISELRNGAGDWEGGDIRRDGKLVARLSPNGRLWDTKPWPECKELDDNFNPKGKQ